MGGACINQFHVRPQYGPSWQFIIVAALSFVVRFSGGDQQRLPRVEMPNVERGRWICDLELVRGYHCEIGKRGGYS